MDRHTDQRSLELERALTAIFETAAEGIVVADKSGTIKVFSRAAQRMFGYDADEIIGRNVSVLMTAPHCERHDEYIRSYLRSRVSRIIGIGRETTGMRKDGSRFPLYLSVGEVTRGEIFIGIVRDLTDSKKAERERQHLQEKLAHVGRVGIMGEIASSIAHEVTQPLTAIASYAQACRRMMEAQPDADRRVLEIVEKINQQALRGGLVIERLREFARRRTTGSEPSDINELVTEVSRLCEIEARRHNVVIDISPGKNLPPVFVDRVQIQQVILNLVCNGVEAITESNPEERRVEVTTSLNGDKEILVLVSDSGAGLTDQAARDAFEPFFTTKASGVGMGLPICRTIVQAHGGKLWLQSKHGPGAAFCFTLPRHEDGRQ